MAATDDVVPIGALAEPVRRRLYEYVVAQGDPVDRDAAALGVGIARPLAAFHLDRLVDAGLLAVEFHRRSGRTGPGAGRPAKFYRRPRGREVSVSLPPRQYDLAADILANALEDAPESVAILAAAARERGRSIAGEVAPEGREALLDLLVDNGYEPVADADGVIRLRNCPFDRLVERHRRLTCSMNLALLEGMTAAADDLDLVPRADPRDGYCCVAFVPEAHARATSAGPADPPSPAP